MDNIISRVYGSVRTQALANYADLAEKTGFRMIFERDITAETLPTFDVISQMFGQGSKGSSMFSGLPTKLVQWGQQSRSILYQVLAYEKV